MIKEVRDWGDDDEDMYEKLSFASGSNESHIEMIKKAIIGRRADMIFDVQNKLKEFKK